MWWKGGENLEKKRISYLALQLADEEAVENLACLIRVANILKGFCRVLTAHVEEDFLTTAVSAR